MDWSSLLCLFLVPLMLRQCLIWVCSCPRQLRRITFGIPSDPSEAKVEWSKFPSGSVEEIEAKSSIQPFAWSPLRLTSFPNEPNLDPHSSKRDGHLSRLHTPLIRPLLEGKAKSKSSLSPYDHPRSPRAYSIYSNINISFKVWLIWRRIVVPTPCVASPSPTRLARTFSCSN